MGQKEMTLFSSIKVKATELIVDGDSSALQGILFDDGSFRNPYICANDIDKIDNLKIVEDKLVYDTSLSVLGLKEYNRRVFQKLLKEAPFKRDIQLELEQWKNRNGNIDNKNKVAQLEGSRQVGKTTELMKFAYKNYKYVIYVNCILDADKFYNKISRPAGTNPGIREYCFENNLFSYVDTSDTILIIDEIQNDIPLYNRIRNLRSDLKCDIIVTGSYLARTLRDDVFLPAGTITYLTLHNMSFKEICKAYNKEKLLDSIILEDLAKSIKVVNDELSIIYDIYMKTGAYPAIVNQYKMNNDDTEVKSLLHDLLKTFRDESSNYFQDDKDAIIFDNVYSQIYKTLPIFNKTGDDTKADSGTKLIRTLTDVVAKTSNSHISKDEINRSLVWLHYCKMLGYCSLYNEADITDSKPCRRVYFMDVGIANYICDEYNMSDSDAIGFTTENFVYTELVRLYSGNLKILKGEVPHFSTVGTYELDFMVIGTDKNIYGIEVKSSSNSTKSLNHDLDKQYIDIAIVAKDTEGGVVNSKYTIPKYAIAHILGLLIK